jgi:hypothetical protein
MHSSAQQKLFQQKQTYIGTCNQKCSVCSACYILDFSIFIRPLTKSKGSSVRIIPFIPTLIIFMNVNFLMSMFIIFVMFVFFPYVEYRAHFGGCSNPVVFVQE